MKWSLAAHDIPDFPTLIDKAIRVEDSSETVIESCQRMMDCAKISKLCLADRDRTFGSHQTYFLQRHHLQGLANAMAEVVWFQTLLKEICIFFSQERKYCGVMIWVQLTYLPIQCFMPERSI